MSYPRGTFSTPLVEWRTRMGLEQGELAKLLRIDPSVVSLWEMGRRRIPEHRLWQIARIFGFPEPQERTLPKPPPMVRSKQEPVAVQPRRFIDPADPRENDSDVREHYQAWATQEAGRERRARYFWLRTGQPHYLPSFEAIQMGPSVRCRRGHLYCRSDHAFEVRATRSVQHERRSA